MNKTSGRDINDKLMKSAGFVRHPTLDNPKFNATKSITYWLGENKMVIITDKNEKLSLSELIKKIYFQVEYITQETIKNKIDTALREILLDILH